MSRRVQVPLGAATEDEPSADDDGETDVRLVMARCSLLHAQGRMREFADCAKIVVFGFCREAVDNERLRGSIVEYRRMRNRLRVRTAQLVWNECGCFEYNYADKIVCWWRHWMICVALCVFSAEHA